MPMSPLPYGSMTLVVVLVNQMVPSPNAKLSLAFWISMNRWISAVAFVVVSMVVDLHTVPWLVGVNDSRAYSHVHWRRMLLYCAVGVLTPAFHS